MEYDFGLNSTVKEIELCLKKAREEGKSIYIIASLLQVLRNKGARRSIENNDLSGEEEEKLYSTFLRLRISKGKEGRFMSGLPYGHELARMFALIKYFFPHIKHELNKKEVASMQAAFEIWQNQKNWRQMASLDVACKFIGINLKIDLGLNEKKEFERALAALT